MTRNVSSSHGSKNSLQRALLYRHEKILLGREDCRPGPKKTVYGDRVVFHWLLGMHQFVWARALCGIRYGCLAAVDCSGTIQKIHMRKPELPRVTSMHANVMDFMIRGRLTRILKRVRAQGSALTGNDSQSCSCFRLEASARRVMIRRAAPASV